MEGETRRLEDPREEAAAGFVSENSDHFRPEGRINFLSILIFGMGKKGNSFSEWIRHRMVLYIEK